MVILDNLSDVLGGGKSEAKGEDKGILDSIMGMLGDKKSGGLDGLLKSFEGSGLGNIISSWVGKGENLPVSGDQIKSALGNDTIQNMAKKLGISEDTVSQKVAGVLPGLIDKLTPDGKVPNGNILQEGLDFLKKKIF
jgi:uncharacterized protein YidB (DUF937 family)